jgi:hypothetical protein
LFRVMAKEAGASYQKISEMAKNARKKESMPICFLRRTRHWTDGAIIGSKAFVQEVGILFDKKDRVMKKQFLSGITPEGIVMHCFRRLRVSLN